MAGINSISGQSANGLYGDRNVLTGLASGMDTESMIQNSVSGYKVKINGLQQQQQMIQWKQDGYRSLIDKMAAMVKKYTSYTSNTNLFSASFFNKAVATITHGANAGKISATGKTSSNVQIDAVKQLAAAARYSAGVNSTGINSGVSSVTDASGNVIGYEATGEAIDWTEPVNISDISGTMTLTYGKKTVELEFGELDSYNNAEELAQGIRDKLGQVNITTSSGEYVKADTRIDVKVSDDGKISFSDKSNAGNSVYISGASDGMKNVLGITPGEDADSFTVAAGTALFHEAQLSEYLSGKTVNVTLDGVTKKITIPSLTGSADPMADLTTGLNDALKSAFGTVNGVNKVQVGADGGALTFTVGKGSTLSVTSPVGEKLGMGDHGLTSYLNTSKTLGELLGPDIADQPLIINGVNVGTFGKDTALETVLTAINGNSEAGVSVSFSKLTNEFVFTSKQTGLAGKVDFDSDLAAKLFGGGTLSEGQDAIFTATINGSQMEMTRPTNVADIDGLSVTLNGTFGYEKNDVGDMVRVDTEAVTFTTKSDSNKIVDAIKSFVDDYNELVTALRDTYSTLPVTKSDGSKYTPLTAADKAEMSESAIKAYEDKVKQGLLFGDKELSSLYSQLRSAITPNGNDGGILRSIGITTAYKDGLTTLSLDEEALRAALDSDPDKVCDAFTKSKEGGSPTNGLMQNIKAVMDDYASVSVSRPGILVQKAGTKLSSLSLKDNYLQKQLDELDKQVDKWQNKMSNRVDYYTRQFTSLEKLMAQMNSQSSMLAGMMGGY